MRKETAKAVVCEDPRHWVAKQKERDGTSGRKQHPFLRETKKQCIKLPNYFAEARTPTASFPPTASLQLLPSFPARTEGKVSVQKPRSYQYDNALVRWAKKWAAETTEERGGIAFITVKVGIGGGGGLMRIIALLNKVQYVDPKKSWGDKIRKGSKKIFWGACGS